DGVHYREDRDFRQSHLAERAALPRLLPVLGPEVPADVNEPAGSTTTQRKPSRLGSLEGCSPKFLGWIDGVGSVIEVEHNRAGDIRDIVLLVGVAPHGQDLCHYAGGGLQSVARAAGEADRINPRGVRVVVTQPDPVRHQSPRRTPADIDGGEHPPGEVENRSSRGSFLVFRNADVQRWEIELAGWPFKRSLWKQLRGRGWR